MGSEQSYKVANAYTYVDLEQRMTKFAKTLKEENVTINASKMRFIHSFESLAKNYIEGTEDFCKKTIMV